MTAARRDLVTALRRSLRGRGGEIAILAAASLLGGAAEALVMAVITAAGFAIAGGRPSVSAPAALGEVDARWALVVAIGVTLARFGLDMLGAAVSARLNTGVIANTRKDLASAFLDTSWSLKQQEKSGRLQELLTNFSEKGADLTRALTQMIAALFSLLALLGAAMLINPSASLLAVAVIAVLALALLPLQAVIRRQASRSIGSEMDFATSLAELSGIGLLLHAFNIQARVRERIVGLIDGDAAIQRRLAVLHQLVPSVYTGLAFLAMTAALAAATLARPGQLLSLGVVMLLMLRSLNYGRSLQHAAVSIASSSPFLAALADHLARYRKGYGRDGGAAPGPLDALELRRVGFCYAPGQPVLRGLDATFRRGELIGVIGPSGGGKSTLALLILGLIEPDKGQILVDGRSLTTLSRQAWLRRVAFAPQAASLIAGSVADNIRLFRDSVDDEAIRRAAAMAHLHEDIMTWPELYQTQVGEWGSRLSGGQQQRLCIARALADDPDILILDEPSSALDYRSENLLRDSLLTLRERKLVIVVSHRRSIIQACDRVAVISEGELVACDSPDVLRRTNAYYRELLSRPVLA